MATYVLQIIYILKVTCYLVEFLLLERLLSPQLRTIFFSWAVTRHLSKFHLDNINQFYTLLTSTFNSLLKHLSLEQPPAIRWYTRVGILPISSRAFNHQAWPTNQPNENEGRSKSVNICTNIYKLNYYIIKKKIWTYACNMNHIIYFITFN